MRIFSTMFKSKQNTEPYADTSNFIVIDVRTPEEYNAGHVDGALLLDIFDPQFKSKISKLDKSKIYKVYCRTGNRSGQTEMMMQTLGFANVENLGSVNQAARRLNKNIIS